MSGVTRSSKWLFVTTGIYAILCLPAILIVERLGWTERPFHSTQFLAVALCFPASLTFLWRTRGTPCGVSRGLASAAALLSGLWLSFVVYVFMTIDFGVTHHH
jgi:hypothetical protein